MTAIGNLLLLIAAFAYAGLIHILYFSNVPRGGDYAVGYSWSILILNAAFIISITLAYCIIAGKGGFAWVSNTRISRFFIVSGGLLAILITNALSGFFKNEPGPMPVLLCSLSSVIPIIAPLVLTVIGFILINNSSLPIAAYKLPLLFTAIIGVVGVAGFLYMYIADEAANKKAVLEYNARFEDNNRKRILQDIDSCDVAKDMVFILVFTDANQYPEVREKALAKIKTNPQWQQELVKRLQTDWAPEVFTFLASNTVDDTAMFITPIKVGILRQAGLIRESIRRSSHPSHFYPGLFLYEVERVLRTVDRFKKSTENYLVEVNSLRAALDEPSDFDKPVFACIQVLEKWMSQNQ